MSDDQEKQGQDYGRREREVTDTRRKDRYLS